MLLFIIFVIVDLFKSFFCFSGDGRDDGLLVGDREEDIEFRKVLRSEARSSTELFRVH